MAYSPSRPTKSDHITRQQSSKSPKMAMLTASPAPPAGFYREQPWDNSRFPSYSPRLTPSSTSISLPSIRHQFADLLTQEIPAPHARPTDSSPSSIKPGPTTSPSYVHSPVSNKRRRGSIEDEQELGRVRQVPRVYHAHEYAGHTPSPTSRPPTAVTWGQPTRSSPPISSRARIPPPVEMSNRVDPCPSLPTLPPALGADRGSVPRPPTRDHYVEDYRDHRQVMTPQVASVGEVSPRYTHATYDYSYRHVSHASHANAAAVAATSPQHQPQDRTPFSVGPYPPRYAEYSRYSDQGQMGLGMDGKQRKRRGNLPKETTDKLRGWFLTHLSHPYPTEDEKQELMRQTGLQMNQISNWFINARRRQLPTMINNARVESDAMSARSTEGKILPSTERTDLHTQRDGLTLSDGEGGAYDEELEVFGRHRAPGMSRGSV